MLGHMGLLPAQGQAQVGGQCLPLGGRWPGGRGWALPLGPGKAG